MDQKEFRFKLPDADNILRGAPPSQQVLIAALLDLLKQVANSDH